MPVLAVTLISPMVPQMRRHFTATPGADVLAPMVLIAPALSLTLASPFTGLLADRIDRKRFLLIAMACYATWWERWAWPGRRTCATCSSRAS
ncbi:hypothetical protein ACFY4I_39465 [Streptomyces scabiei]|uniref:hypothetical protein n=1 Tax=Streptomyces scabiei TaxID=1930 RepID=UPI00369620ED